MQSYKTSTDHNDLPEGKVGVLMRHQKSSNLEVPALKECAYDATIWVLSLVVGFFFRVILYRKTSNIPRKGPVLFIAGPHNNQFVDAILIQSAVRNEAGRRLSMLTAHKSLRGFGGCIPRQLEAIPVHRAQDLAKPAMGTIFLPDPINKPDIIHGRGTNFVNEAEVGGSIFLPSVSGKTSRSAVVSEILDPTHIRIKQAFTDKDSLLQLTSQFDIEHRGRSRGQELQGPGSGHQGSKFKLVPRVDQSELFQAVLNRLQSEGSVVSAKSCLSFHSQPCCPAASGTDLELQCIFPEGGSHDRADMLPFKAGAATIALSAACHDPKCDLAIVPVGLHYFNGHKFRSRAVVEFGLPFKVPGHLVARYKTDRRGAIGDFLGLCKSALDRVTVSSPDHETLNVVRTARRLYQHYGKPPLSYVVALDRKFSKLFDARRDQRTLLLMKEIGEYNRQIQLLGLKDYQVASTEQSLPKVLYLLVIRVIVLAALSVGVIPGLVLFTPILVVAKYVSSKQAKIALKMSSVKIWGRDVMATYKGFVSVLFTPLCFTFYSYVLSHTGIWWYVPYRMPWCGHLFLGWAVIAALCILALSLGDMAMEILKSLLPLLLSLTPSSRSALRSIRLQRIQTARKVNKLIGYLDPETRLEFERLRLGKDFDSCGATSNSKAE
ncbi:acyltransferase [Apiospora arundinis]